MSNGEPFCERTDEKTPFKFISADKATEDLPSIGDGTPDCCIKFSDHQLSIGFTRTPRQQLFLTPIQPYGMNYSKARHGYPDRRTGRMVEAVMYDADC